MLAQNARALRLERHGDVANRYATRVVILNGMGAKELV